MQTHAFFKKLSRPLLFAGLCAMIWLAAGSALAQDAGDQAAPPVRDSAEARAMQQIEEAVAAGNTDQALLLMAKALIYTDDPAKKARIYVSRGQLYLRLGRTPEALNDLDAAVRLAPDDPVPSEARGLAWFHLQNPGLAIPDLDRARDLGSKDPAAYTARGNLYLERNNTLGALAAYDAALALDPAYVEALFQRAYVYSMLGHYDLALEAFERVIAQFPDQAFPYNNRGIVYAQSGRVAASREDFAKAVEIDPDYASAWSNLGYTDFLLGNMDAALEAFDKSDAADKNNPYCLCNRVEAYFRAGEKIKTRGALKKCIKAAASDPLFQREEAYYIAALKTLKDMIDEQNELPAFDALMDNAAKARDANKRKFAFSYYSLAHMLNPDDAEALFNLGAVSHSLGRRAYALTFLNRYLEAFPEGDNAEAANSILDTLILPLPEPPQDNAAMAPVTPAPDQFSK